MRMRIKVLCVNLQNRNTLFCMLFSVQCKGRDIGHHVVCNGYISPPFHYSVCPGMCIKACFARALLQTIWIPNDITKHNMERGGKVSLVTLPYLYDDDGHKNQADVKLPRSSGDARCTYLAVVGSTSERAKFYIIRRKAIASGSEVTSGLAGFNYVSLRYYRRVCAIAGVYTSVSGRLHSQLRIKSRTWYIRTRCQR